MLDKSRHIYAFDEFDMDIEEELFLSSGEPVHLDPKELNLLVYMLQHTVRVLEKDELLSAVWDTIVEEGRLTQVASSL